ncbi:MAG TPA: hypothetical protein VFV89_20050 [Nocardioides sp.]|uniref:hypothetical protein n=1 Tax=Nocardioides sp. TaxID=35761 RepID=UPI002E3311DD|nr:hypothetical protein [Nocardioides sp.]HEX5090112.1 hypothetical protein [Nocardioides sp.]
MEHDDRHRGFHQVNIGHLVMGVAFVAIVGIWALVQGDVVTGDDTRWLMPVPWVLAGVVGLVATAITGSRRHAVRQTGWAGQGVQPGTGAGWVGAQDSDDTDETAPITAQQDDQNPPDDESVRDPETNHENDQETS